MQVGVGLLCCVYRDRKQVFADRKLSSRASATDMGHRTCRQGAEKCAAEAQALAGSKKSGMHAVKAAETYYLTLARSMLVLACRLCRKFAIPNRVKSLIELFCSASQGPTASQVRYERWTAALLFQCAYPQSTACPATFEVPHTILYVGRQASWSGKACMA